MQAPRRIAKLILPVVIGAMGIIGLPGLAADVFAGELRSPVQVDSVPVAAVSVPVMVAAPSPSIRSDNDASFGVAMSAEQLEAHRGGEMVFNNMNLTGTVADNTARGVATGSNAITAGSFANSSGLPTVIQNTGANVLIQNATILNVRFGE
jgi:hypothetical protein